MSSVTHSEVIVKTEFYTKALQAHVTAKGIFSGSVTNIHLSEINGFYTFYIPSSGSKDTWDASIAHISNICLFSDWIDTQDYEDGSSPFDCHYIRYGSDRDLSETEKERVKNKFVDLQKFELVGL